MYGSNMVTDSLLNICKMRKKERKRLFLYLILRKKNYKDIQETFDKMSKGLEYLSDLFQVSFTRYFKNFLSDICVLSPNKFILVSNRSFNCQCGEYVLKCMIQTNRSNTSKSNDCCQNDSTSHTI